MPTSTTSPKVQVPNPKAQGPNLRAAIAELPLRGHGLTRERLEDATPGEVASAISDRIVNDLVYSIDVIVGAADSHRQGFGESLQCGLHVIESDLNDEFRRIGRLAWAIGADEVRR